MEPTSNSTNCELEEKKRKKKFEEIVFCFLRLRLWRKPRWDKGVQPLAYLGQRLLWPNFVPGKSGICSILPFSST